jgi:acyl carrier protein
MNARIDQDMLSARVKAIIAGVLQIDVQDLVAEKSLKDQGLDSLCLLFLIDELEAEFEIRLIGEELEVEHFKSANSITSLLNDNYQVSGN